MRTFKLGRSGDFRIRTQCYHFQQFYNRHNVKVHVPIIRWSHCVGRSRDFRVRKEWELLN